MTRRCVALVLAAVGASGCLHGDEVPQPPPRRAPLFAPGPPRPPAPPQEFGWRESRDAFVFRNDDGAWTIYKRCFDRIVRGRRWTAGPGYVVRLTDRSGRRLVDDYVPRRDLWSPGYLNAMHGGLGTFGWHHARGRAGATPAGDDPTTARVERRVDRVLPGYSLEGRMCARSTGGTGVHAVAWSGPQRRGDALVLRFDVSLRDPGAPVARVRYAYTFERSLVRVDVEVRTFRVLRRFVKEPKLVALVRGGGYRRMSIYGGSYQKGVLEGAPEETRVLSTDHSAQPDRVRVTWDYGTDADEEGPDACREGECFTVAAAATPETLWENGRAGFDGWAVAAAREASTWPRDTRGALVVSTCGADPRPDDDADGNGLLDARERARASERTSPALDALRRWEHGGWKARARGDARENPARYTASSTAFLGWQGSRGPGDCEPLERALRPGTWTAYLVYSVGDGWEDAVDALLTR